MSMIHGGQLLAKALKKEGVDRVFTLGGDHTMAMYYGLVDEGIEIKDARHESAAVAMAIGYARSQGKPAVVLVTAGPGVANTFGAVTDATQDGTPIFLICGGSPVDQNQTGSMQELDLLPSFKPITRWCERVYDPKRIADYVHIGFRHMTSFGKPGPCLLEIPFDVLNDVVDEELAADPGNTRITDPVVLGDPDAVEKAAQMLVAAERPVMVISREVVFYPRNLEYIAKLCEYLNMPSGAMFEAKGICDERNPLHAIGLGATGMADTIVLLNVTADFTFDFLNEPRFNPAAKYISINVDSAQIGFNKPFEVGIVGTPGDVIKQIYDRVVELTPARTDYKFLQEAGAVLAAYGEAGAAKAASEQIPIHPARACAEITKYLNENPDFTIVTDGGDAAANLTSTLAADHPQKLVYSGRYGAIGFSLPISIGAHYGTGSRVLLCTGDGSLGFFMGELTTVVGRNLPITIVCLNDSAWGMIRSMEAVLHGEVLAKYESADLYSIAMNLPKDLRYDKIVEGLGGYGEMVTDPNEIYPALKRAEESGKPALINVITEDNTKVMTDPTAGFGYAFKKYVKF